MVSKRTKDKEIDDLVESMEVGGPACRAGYKIRSEMLEGVKKKMEDEGGESGYVPRDKFMKAVGRPETDETSAHTVSYCMNEQIRKNKELRRYGLAIGVATEPDPEDPTKKTVYYVFKKRNWWDWETQQGKEHPEGTTEKDG